MSHDDWVTVAESDNSVVAEILLRLRQTKIPVTVSKSQPARKLEWSVRQRRSRPPVLRKNGGEPTRASPSTPLSWSDGTSLSSSGGGGGGGLAGAGGVDEYADARPLENVRSKLAVANESTNTKRPRRKKTLAQLRDEEGFLLDERRELTSKLSSVYRNIERLRGNNEKLKKMKLDLQSTGKIGTTSVASEETISDQLQQMDDADEDQACSNSATSAIYINSNPTLPIKPSKVVEKATYSFVLPDLNLPFEDGSESNRIS